MNLAMTSTCEATFSFPYTPTPMNTFGFRWNGQRTRRWFSGMPARMLSCYPFLCGLRDWLISMFVALPCFILPDQWLGAEIEQADKICPDTGLCWRSTFCATRYHTQHGAIRTVIKNHAWTGQ